MERAAPQTRRIAVLTSGHGRGSNLRAIHSWFRERDLPVDIAFVTVSRSDVPVVELCRELGLTCHVMPGKDSAAFEIQLLELCRNHNVVLLALAGFMRLLSADFITALGIPILNIHPALLPKFGGAGMYGSRVHEAVYAAGERVSGASVHLVDPQYDHGAVLAQLQTDISDCRSAEEIAAKVLSLEHQLYAPTIYSYLNRRDS